MNYQDFMVERVEERPLTALGWLFRQMELREVGI
jgi:hypothetical protein